MVLTCADDLADTIQSGSTKACCFHQDQADCNFSSSFPNRRLQCSYHEPQKQREWAALTARQVSLHKGQKHLSKLRSTWQSKQNPKDIVRIQYATPLFCGLHSRPLASPPEHSWFGAGLLPVALRGCKHAVFPTRHQKHWLFPELMNWLFSGYMSLQDLNFLCLSCLQKVLL